MIILIILIRLQLYIKPFKLNANNELESISFAASALTMFGGILYISEVKRVSTLDLIAFFLIITVNTYFILLWIYFVSYSFHKYHYARRFTELLRVALCRRRDINDSDFYTPTNKSTKDRKLEFKKSKVKKKTKKRKLVRRREAFDEEYEERKATPKRKARTRRKKPALPEEEEKEQIQIPGLGSDIEVYAVEVYKELEKEEEAKTNDNNDKPNDQLEERESKTLRKMFGKLMVVVEEDSFFYSSSIRGITSSDKYIK